MFVGLVRSRSWSFTLPTYQLLLAKKGLSFTQCNCIWSWFFCVDLVMPSKPISIVVCQLKKWTITNCQIAGQNRSVTKIQKYRKQIYKTNFHPFLWFPGEVLLKTADRSIVHRCDVSSHFSACDLCHCVLMYTLPFQASWEGHVYKAYAKSWRNGGFLHAVSFLWQTIWCNP